MFGEGDVEEEQFVPESAEDFVGEAIFVGVSPEGDEGVELFAHELLIPAVEDVVDVKFMEPCPRSLPLPSGRLELSFRRVTSLRICGIFISCLRSKKEACYTSMFHICSSWLKVSGSHSIMWGWDCADAGLPASSG